MADTEVTLWPQSRHEVVMLLGKEAEIEPRQVNHVMWSGRDVGDSRDRQETEKRRRGKEGVCGRKRRAAGLGAGLTGDRALEQQRRREDRRARASGFPKPGTSQTTKGTAELL